jgi:signal transduction histidine kinase
VTRLRPELRILLGAFIGVGSALIAVLLADAASVVTPLTVIPVLAVALVGLGLGSRSALMAYGAAGLIIILFAILPAHEPIAGADAIQLASFVIGAPFIVLLALAADRRRWDAARARDASDIAERQALLQTARAESARSQLNTALQAAERERLRLAEVAEAVPEPLIVYDAEPRGTYGNRAALRVFGRSFFDRSLAEWAHTAEPRDAQGGALPQAEWPQVRAQLAPIRQRLIVRLPMSGRDALIDVEGTPIPGGGCVLLLRDVGKEEDERRRLSRFASFVAHELRNPLAVAKARIELAQREPELPQRAASHAVRALESVHAAIGILERLELYSRADAGGVEAERLPFDVAAAVDAAIERLRTRGSEREVRCALPRDRVMAMGDRPLAEQAIANLLTNADRYSTDGLGIEVEVVDDDPVVVRVIDGGPGIADDLAERLFHDRLAVGRGLGLGLYLVHATMTAQGGSVQLEERRPRAVFALRWPAVPAAGDAAPANQVLDEGSLAV